MTAILEKYFTREYSLFCAAVWCEANTKLASEWVNYNSENVLFVNEGQGKKFSVWYDPKEDHWDRNIVELINTDPTYFDRLKKSFHEHFDAMINYDSGKTPITSFADLKNYIDHYLKWWTPMAIIMHLPNLSPIPEAAKQEAIKIREATQDFSDADDKVFAPFIENHFPEYADLIPILTSAEILSLEQGKFLPEKLAEIKERKNGYVYFNNQIYPLNKLDQVLEKNDLFLLGLRPIELMQTSVRDFSLGYVEARYAGLVKLIRDILGLKIRGDFYLAANNRGLIASYLDQAILGQVMQMIVEKNQQDQNFSDKIYSQFDEAIGKIKPYWEKEHLSTRKEMLDFIDLFVEVLALGSWVMGLAVFAPNLPEAEQEKARRYRAENDTFADYGDKLIKNTLKYLYPDLAAYDKFISWNEIKDDKKPTLAELDQRKDFYLYTDSQLITNQSLADFCGEHNLILPKEEASAETRELKGEVAYRGKVTGSVRVILLKEELGTIQDGEVLVSSMTTPLFLPAMKKAAAFVTDEGGITCHAAIVARELKKPCIVGTRFATRALKNGDVVEVDADQGIVRILEKQKQ